MQLSQLKSKQKIIVLMVLLGAGLFLVGAHYQTNPQSTEPVKLKITRTSTGGFSGTGDKANLTLSNTRIESNGKSKALSQKELSTINDKINNAHFFELSRDYKCKGCADGFVTTLSISNEGSSNTVTFEDFSNAPPALLDLDNFLVNLIR